MRLEEQVTGVTAEAAIGGVIVSFRTRRRGAFYHPRRDRPRVRTAVVVLTRGEAHGVLASFSACESFLERRGEREVHISPGDDEGTYGWFIVRDEDGVTFELDVTAQSRDEICTALRGALADGPRETHYRLYDHRELAAEDGE